MFIFELFLKFGVISKLLIFDLIGFLNLVFFSFQFDWPDQLSLQMTELALALCRFDAEKILSFRGDF